MSPTTAILYGDGVATGAEIISVLGIKLDNLTMTDTVEAIIAQLDQSGARQICFVNAHCANLAHRAPYYARVLNRAWLTLADGIGMTLARKLFARAIRQTANGTELLRRRSAG